MRWGPISHLGSVLRFERQCQLCGHSALEPDEQRGETSSPHRLLRPLVHPWWAQRGCIRDCNFLIVEAKLQSRLISHTETAFL
jgi:hypothetical protein